MIRIKSSVDLAGLRPEMTPVFINAHALAQGQGVDLWITSCRDSKHGRGSLHYVGLALDLRSKNLSDKHDFVRDLGAALGRQYDVLLEAEGKRNEHIHVEFQPK